MFWPAKTLMFPLGRAGRRYIKHIMQFVPPRVCRRSPCRRCNGNYQSRRGRTSSGVLIVASICGARGFFHISQRALAGRSIRSPRRQGRVASAARQCRARHDCAEHCSGVRGFVVRRLYDVSEMALLSHILYDWRSPNHLILRPQMLDNSKKTEPLLVALKAAVPFEVELMPALIEHLRVKNIATLNEIRQTVSDVSYAGDEGGIVCHIVPSDIREALVVSLTHVRMPRTMPLASAVIDYQKHRVKKLKKQR